jgi:2-hydroxy-3-keto-5-methylthiopentenyl-1-phosphate phosphatase
MLSVDKTPVLISDFDKTITKIDFFYYVVKNYLKKEDLKPWDEYIAGNLRHFEALQQIFSKVKIPLEQFHNDILQIPVEEDFVKVVKYCKKNNIKVYIISAGAEYYIKILLKKMEIQNDITLFSNKSYYSTEKGLYMERLNPGELFYCPEYGINKEKIVKAIKNDCNYCIYAGDGRSDRPAARHADRIFAKDALLEYCKENNIEATELISYRQILEFLTHDQSTS